jgi:hypothetical protein
VNNVAAFLIPNIFVNNVFRKGNLLKINDIHDSDINIPIGFNDINDLFLFCDVTSPFGQAVGIFLLIFLFDIVLIFNSCSILFKERYDFINIIWKSVYY